jgi:hypothetical protein
MPIEAPVVHSKTAAGHIEAPHAHIEANQATENRKKKNR